MAAKTSGIDTILKRWRDEIKAKQRRIISFEETVEIKINSIKSWIYQDIEQLDSWEFRQFIYTSERTKNFIDESWKPLKVGSHWGGPNMSAEFRCNAKIPARFKGKKVALKLYFGGDGLLNINKTPYHGLDPFRDTVILTEKATGSETYEFEAESYILWHFGEPEIKDFECSYFAIMDQQINDIYWDFRAAHNVMINPKADKSLLEFLKRGFSKAIAPIDQNELSPEKFRANMLLAHKILRTEIYETEHFKAKGLLHGCANSHLDVVFLWTHAEFVRKLGRTHASTLRLMEQFPDYVFSQSQPLMYQEMKETFPTMFEEVKKRVKEKRWEVIGSMWVEPDCNVLSGESFVRQLVYGIDFAESEFGVTPRTCWCPDVFGNAWTMPQILVKAGLKYFVTHKMVVWNDTNPWRKNTFWWQGPDGSRIFSLVPPTHFIGTVEPDHMAGHWENYSEKATIGESLYNYGWGDGGGGPDPEMLEYLKRYENFPGVVPIKPAFIETALESMYQKSTNPADPVDLPTWNDELYLEEHRGVHTTKARLKKLNRLCETLYRKAELFSVFSGIQYPQEKLKNGWLDVLTNQFHDSLPGSHIPPVYLDLQKTYSRTVANGSAILDDALMSIARAADTRGDGMAYVVFNSLGRARTTTVSIQMPATEIHVVDAGGTQIPHQFVTPMESGVSTLLFVATDVPACGYAVYHVKKGAGTAQFGAVAVSINTLENEFLKVVINGEGEIVSLFDKLAGRESFSVERRGNVLKLYEDVPGKYAAWDIAPSYTDVEFDMSGASVAVDENGAVRSSIMVTRDFRNSKMKQRIILGAQSKRVDFETWVDWKEQEKLLKTRFFTDITTKTATYDIPFGTIERSTYRNNSFDEAKFEVCGHQWMDLSQPDYGISLLNNCKYGHDAFGGMMALSLLRGPLNPDPTSDQEEHYFTYSLYPHAGTWRDGQTMQEALDLNHPVDAIATDPRAGMLPSAFSFVSIDAPNVALEACKKAEKSDDLIIRIVERTGMQSAVTIKLSKPVISVNECNLLEREDVKAVFEGDIIPLTIKPFEIRTFKIKM